MSNLAGVLLKLFIAWVAGSGAGDTTTPVVHPKPEAITWVSLPRGTATPLFPDSQATARVTVDAFELARTPVTNAEFLEFVERRPEWRRDRISSLFADGRYLAHWAGPDGLASGSADRPVTNVSWFAARAFCEDAGSRLPTEMEWERAAAASRTAADGRDDPAWSRAILEWYAAPSSGPERDVGRGQANFWGVHDLTGLAWEWVLDFNSNFVSSDSRNPRTNDPLKFCGGGTLGARDPQNYAAFMRIAFLSSLEARYATQHLGFRCARDTRKVEP